MVIASGEELVVCVFDSLEAATAVCERVALTYPEIQFEQSGAVVAFEEHDWVFVWRELRPEGLREARGSGC